MSGTSRYYLLVVEGSGDVHGMECLLVNSNHGNLSVCNHPPTMPVKTANRGTSSDGKYEGAMAVLAQIMPNE